MNRIGLTLIGLIIGSFSCSTATFAQTSETKSIEIAAWPANMQEFKQLHAKLSPTPEGSAALLLAAFKLYVQNPALGEQALTLVVHPELLVPSETGYEGYGLRNSDMMLLKMQLQHKVVNSYVVGSSPSNGYALEGNGPWRFYFQNSDLRQDTMAHKLKLFVVSSGASNPRPIMLHREPANANGLWYVQDWSALLMPVQ